MFIAEMNNLQVRAADIGNAYLHTTTREKVYFVAGPEFGPEFEGRILLIVKMLRFEILRVILRVIFIIILHGREKFIILN